MGSAKFVLVAALCAMLFAAGAVDAQNFTQEQAKKMAGTIIAGCKDLKSKTCQIYLKTAGTFCTNPKNVKFCSNILMETCKVSKTECGRLKGPFCAQTGAQKANCEKMASNALKAMG